MLSYKALMPNRRSTKKSLRSAARKQLHNLSWKRRYKSAVKDLKETLALKDATPVVLNEKLTLVQKLVDKAVKEKVIHKNKANRVKSTYAKKITAQSKKPTKAKATA